MRYLYILLLLPALTCAQAWAQVNVNQNALDQLNGAPIPPPSAPAPTETLPKPKPAPHHRTKTAAPKPAVKPAPAPAPPPAKPPTPPAAPPAVKPLPPVILSFAPGSAALPSTATTALKPYCTPARQIVIDAYAPGPAADPSIALRLAFDRAFAVQAALTACGVPATAIIARALGNVPGQDTATTHIYFSGSN